MKEDVVATGIHGCPRRAVGENVDLSNRRNGYRKRKRRKICGERLMLHKSVARRESELIGDGKVNVSQSERAENHSVSHRSRFVRIDVLQHQGTRRKRNESKICLRDKRILNHGVRRTDNADATGEDLRGRRVQREHNNQSE